MATDVRNHASQARWGNAEFVVWVFGSPVVLVADRDTGAGSSTAAAARELLDIVQRPDLLDQVSE